MKNCTGRLTTTHLGAAFVVKCGLHPHPIPPPPHPHFTPPLISLQAAGFSAEIGLAEDQFSGHLPKKI
ncbi:hypothetical protein T4E_533 [Trichinella pseudospiralis]|uniref:Uncharacterized protein n=1 Tax=Trichinella pseudospiralis TaxID=6337 RepID=A0A0V0XSW9_TRIPS|nr:hypothetical protein T4E_533 [Trichinella pseudospiralis]